MGYEAYITLDCRRYSERITDIIAAFRKIKWNASNYDGAVEYLPIGDIDVYDWQTSILTESEIDEIINYKQDNDELAGIHLFYACEKAGITLLVSSTSEIMIGLDIYRKVCKDNTTDLAWYFHHIIIPLRMNGCMIDHISFNENID